MTENKTMLNYINGEWRTSGASQQLDVLNPATAEVLHACRSHQQLR